MRLQELLEKINRGEIYPCYYFYGPEVWLIEKTISRLKEKVLTGGNADFNFSVFDAHHDADELILNNLFTLPINSSRRLTVIRSADIIWKSRVHVYLDYLSNPNPQSCAIFVGEKTDRRQKFFQILEREGALVAFYPLSVQEVKKWVGQRVAEAGRRITEEALSLLIELVGLDLTNLEQEVQKLILGTGKGQPIDEDEVLTLSKDLREENPFALAGAVADLNLAKAFSMLQKNLQQGEPPFLLLSLIARQLRLIWKAKELSKEGLPRREIEWQLKIAPSLTQEFWRQAEKISLKKIKEFWPILELADLKIKTSRLPKGLILEECLWDFFKPAQPER